MKIPFTILSFTVMCLSGCKEEKKYNAELVPIDSTSISVEDYVQKGGGNIDYYEENGKKYLFYITYGAKGTNELQIFDLDKKALVEKTTLPVPKGIGMTIHGYTMINKDSIIVTNDVVKSFYMIDKKGKILGEFPYFYQNLQTHQDLYGVAPHKDMPLIYSKQKFYFSNPIYAVKKKGYKDQSMAFSYDLKTKSVNNLEFKIPQDFLNSENFSNQFSYCFDGKNIVYSPENSNDIWITDIDGKNYRKVEAKSDYFRHFSKYTETIVPDMQASYHIAVTNSYYKDIIYDKYRKVYYRFFSPGIDIAKDAKNLQMKCFYPDNISVIILDSNFKKIGETVLPDLKYDYFSNFITEKGLYMYSNVDVSKNYKKNIIKYTLLTLKNE